MKNKIAVIDDQSRMAEVLAMVLSRDHHDVEAFNDSQVFIESIEKRVFDCVITDLKMPNKSGLDVLKAVKAAQPITPVILITAHATVETAINALKNGAFDYLQKPIDNERCRQIVRLALQHTHLLRQNRLLRSAVRASRSIDNLIAHSEVMQTTIELVRRAASSTSTVLITGESGTGKEVVARAIHYYSDRVAQPFVAVNCKAFADGVLESELFGHEKGAFTGAANKKSGIFERASGGSLFLDEIGETSGDFQAKLLRVIQENEIQRVGGTELLTVDCRLIVATNRHINAEVKAGRFREDLYYRLNVIPIDLPPLRDRKADILPLANLFLERVNNEQGRQLHGFTPAVEEYFLGHPWPGNVRELENTVERGAVLARTDQVELSDLQLTQQRVTETSLDKATQTLQEKLDDTARDYIEQVLTQVNGARQAAAKLLGIERTTLYRLLKKYHVE